MALSKRSLQFIAEYPKSKVHWDHPVLQALSSGTIGLLKQLGQKQNSVKIQELTWREVENFLRDSNLISAWNDQDVHGINVIEQWPLVRSWSQFYNIFSSDQFSRNEFQTPDSTDFRYEITIIRQIHDYFEALESVLNMGLQLVDFSGGEIIFSISDSAPEENKKALGLWLQQEFNSRGLSSLKVVAE